MQRVKQDIKQYTQKYTLSFQLPLMNTESPLLTLAFFFPLLQLITYYPLALYMREREREMHLWVLKGVSVSVNYCTVAIVCFGPQNMKCKRLSFKRSIDFFFPLPFWWISQNYTENHFSPIINKDHCWYNFLRDTTNFTP